MAHSEICPVCEGVGILKISKGSEVKDKPCHGCYGKGWIEVSGDASIQVFPPGMDFAGSKKDEDIEAH